MSNKDPQSSALLILSPLAARLLDTQAAVAAATILKNQGVGRADIAMDPRHSFDNRHSHRWAMPSFESAARRIADTVFRPMLGKSDIVDFTRATTDEISAPSLSTLSTVGNIFMRAADKNQSTLGGRNLGFVFYVALHAQTYTHLIYPELSQAQRASLSKELRTMPQTQNLDAFGGLINLDETRARMMDRGSTQASVSPRRTLN